MLTLYQVIAGSHPAVVEPSQPTPAPPVQAPPASNVDDILIPGPVSTLPYFTCFLTLIQLTDKPMLRLQEARLALRNSEHQEDRGSGWLLCLLHHKEDQVHPRVYGNPASSCSWLV